MGSKIGKNKFKMILGILISGIFLYLAFGQIEFDKLIDAFSNVNYWLLIPAVIVQLFSHWLRSLRWYYIIKPIKKIPINNLFSATMIGYMMNSILPVHLGELFRAVILGKKENIPGSSILATIVIERMIDVFSLLGVLVFTLLIYPFPDWVTQSGYFLFLFAVCLFVFLLLLKKQNKYMINLLDFSLRLLPKKLAKHIEEMLKSFIKGINAFEKRSDYLIIFLHSLVIWACYWLVFHIICYSFNLFELYNVNEVLSLVLLIITTVSILIPSSPGYIGTYHFLCQLSLKLFGVPEEVGLSFAIVAHANSLLPSALIGFIYAWNEGIKRLKIDNSDLIEPT